MFMKVNRSQNTAFSQDSKRINDRSMSLNGLHLRLSVGCLSYTKLTLDLDKIGASNSGNKMLKLDPRARYVSITEKKHDSCVRYGVDFWGLWEPTRWFCQQVRRWSVYFTRQPRQKVAAHLIMARFALRAGLSRATRTTTVGTTARLRMWPCGKKTQHWPLQ